MVEWILGRFLVRLSVISGAVVALILFMPVLYSSYWVPLTTDDLEVTLVVRDPTGEPDAVIPSLLGASVDWPDNAHGLYDPNRGLFNPTPVGELIGLDPSYLRFPAGRLSQVYNWTEGVGILDDRGKNPAYGEAQDSLFGTDELYKLVDYADASAVMVANINTGTDEMARDWVSYCNDPPDRRLGKERSANGYPTPYGITHWEIGYEPYRPNYWKDAPTSAIGYGGEYANLLKDYSRLMKTVDTSIRVGAWMVLDPDLERSSADVSWNINFLDEIEGQLLYIGGSSEQYYYYDYVVVKVNLPAIESLMNYGDLYTYSYADVYASLSEDLRDLRKLIEKIDPRPGGIPLAIAFYEPFYGEEGWNIPVPANAGSALMTADMAMQFLDIALRDGVRSVEYACFGQLNTPTYSALMINPDFEQAHLDAWHRSPSYFAFQMCTELQGGKPLSITDQHPISFDTPVEKELQGHKNVPVVSAIASLVSESETIKILLVNRNLDREVICNINLEIEGLSGPMQVSTRTILFDSILSNNLAGSDVTSPLPTSTDAKNFKPPDFKVTLPIAGVVLITIEPKPPSEAA